MNAEKLFAGMIAVVSLMSGCASFDGRGLEPGRSSEAEIVGLMGQPSQKLALPGGGNALYFSRLPEGRAVFVVTIGADGVMKSKEQRLTRANVYKVVPNAWTMKDVRELFGPPGRETRLARQDKTWWEYKYFDYDQRRVFHVGFSDDGVVREMLDERDWEWEKGGALFGPP